MKVLQVNCVYNKGSTGKIIYDLHKGLLSNGEESIVCYGRGEVVKEDNVYKICKELYSKFNNLLSRITGLMYAGCFFSTNKLIRIIKKEKPDVVHLHCLNGYFVNIYRLVTWLKNSGIKTILTLHAEFMHTANCGHAYECEKWKTGCGKCPRLRKETKSWFFDNTHKSWLKMKKAFDGFDDLTIVSVSPWLMERAKQSPILKDKKHCVVLNGLDTSIFKLYDTQQLRKKHNLIGKKIIFHATPFFNDDPENIKGGYYVIKLAEKLLSNDNIRIVVAGNYPKTLKVPSNIILLGRVNNQQTLAEYYSMADVTVLTSKRETFSMVVAESLCCGTPVAGFRAGGPEQIAIMEYCKFVGFGDVVGISKAMTELIDIPISKDEIAKIAAKKYSSKRMVNHTLELYEKDLCVYE